LDWDGNRKGPGSDLASGKPFTGKPERGPEGNLGKYKIPGNVGFLKEMGPRKV